MAVYNTRLYAVWKGIKARCYNQNNPKYKDYGGRGIILCEEWHDYRVFKEWAHENGYDETAPRGVCTIDRTDVNGNYSPGNCRWATIADQLRNKRNSTRVEINGKTQTLSEWARDAGISKGTIFNRYKRGYSLEDLLKPTKGV